MRACHCITLAASLRVRPASLSRLIDHIRTTRLCIDPFCLGRKHSSERANLHRRGLAEHRYLVGSLTLHILIARVCNGEHGSVEDTVCCDDVHISRKDLAEGAQEARNDQGDVKQQRLLYVEAHEAGETRVAREGREADEEDEAGERERVEEVDKWQKGVGELCGCAQSQMSETPLRLVDQQQKAALQVA